MILEAILLTMAILVIVLPFCIWPIFIAMGVNASYKIVEDKVDEFLNENTDAETIDKIYKTAETFEQRCKDNEKTYKNW